MWLIPNCVSSASSPASEGSNSPSIAAPSEWVSALARSAWWNGKPSASHVWSKRWREATWLRALCGSVTSASSLPRSFVDALTSSAGASPARTSQAQGSRPASEDRGQVCSTPFSLPPSMLTLGGSSSRTWLLSASERTRSWSNPSAAYVAGLLDGEGCLTMESKDSPSPRIDVGMTISAKTLLVSLQAQMGGNVRMVRKPTARWAEAWTWTITGERAAIVVAWAWSELRLKQPQATEILRFWLTHGTAATEEMTSRGGTRRRWTKEQKEAARLAAQAISGGNRKGPEVAPAHGWIAQFAGGRWISPQASLFEPTGSEPYSEPFPKQGSMRNGFVYARPTWERRTGATDGSAWQTASVSDVTGGHRTRGGDRSGEVLLPGQAENWPTATVETGAQLASSPTPGQTGGTSLEGAARQFPSLPDPPTSLPGIAFYLATCHGHRRYLNPRFVESLMGFADDWTRPCGIGDTVSVDSETPSSPSKAPLPSLSCGSA